MVYVVGTLCLAFFFFTLLMVASQLLYKSRMNTKYSIRNMFPFELNYKVYFKDNLYTHIFLGLFTMSAIGFFATFDLTYSDGYLIYTMISGIVCALCILLIFYVPLTNLRFHIILDSVLFTLIFSNIASTLIAAWRLNQFNSTWASWTSIIVSIVIGAATFALIMNPRLNLNFKPIEVVKENGEKEYVRPKGIVLAFSEWILIIIYLIEMINIFILTFGL